MVDAFNSDLAEALDKAAQMKTEKGSHIKARTWMNKNVQQESLVGTLKEHGERQRKF